MTLPSCWILIAPLNFDTLLSRNSTGRRYADGSRIPRWIVTPGHDSTLNCDPGSCLHVELWPQVLISRWIVTRGRDHIFNVKFWSRVTIQRGILTRGHNSTWNSDPSAYLLPVELRLNKVSKIQRRDQNSTAREGHYSTKNLLNSDPGSVFNGGVKILSYTGVTDSKSGTWYLSCIYLRKCHAQQREKIMMVWKNISFFSNVKQWYQKKYFEHRIWCVI